MATASPADKFGQKTTKLFLLAVELAFRIPEFHTKKGPGMGDHATATYMKQLREKAAAMFGCEYSEVTVCKKTKHKFDFYIQEEGTVVEIALSLHNPLSEYEKDIFKCLLAKEEGKQIGTLLFVSKPGATARLESSGSRAIAQLVDKHFGLRIEVLEILPGYSVLEELRKGAVQPPR